MRKGKGSSKKRIYNMYKYESSYHYLFLFFLCFFFLFHSHPSVTTIPCDAYFFL